MEVGNRLNRASRGGSLPSQRLASSLLGILAVLPLDTPTQLLLVRLRLSTSNSLLGLHIHSRQLRRRVIRVLHRLVIRSRAIRNNNRCPAPATR